MHFKNSLQEPFSFKIQVSLVIEIKKGRDIIYTGMSAIDVKMYTVYVTKMGIFSFEKLQLLFKKKQQRYIIKKMINIAIRATYYTFCCRNRNWDSPDLMQF